MLVHRVSGYPCQSLWHSHKENEIFRTGTVLAKIDKDSNKDQPGVGLYLAAPVRFVRSRFTCDGIASPFLPPLYAFILASVTTTHNLITNCSPVDA